MRIINYTDLLDKYNSLNEKSYLLSGKNRTVLMKSIKELKDEMGDQSKEKE